MEPEQLVLLSTKVVKDLKDWTEAVSARNGLTAEQLVVLRQAADHRTGYVRQHSSATGLRLFPPSANCPAV